MMNLKRLALVVTLLGVATAVAGCMGSFTLTKKLYGFNDTITGSKIVNNLIFWGLNIVPVYSLAIAGDAIIFNTIEFWTGSNLLADASNGGGDARVAVVDNGDGSLTVTRAGETFTLVPQGENRVQVVRNGVVVGEAVRNADGSVVAYDDNAIERAVVAAVDVDAVASVVADAVAAEAVAAR